MHYHQLMECVCYNSERGNSLNTSDFQQPLKVSAMKDTIQTQCCFYIPVASYCTYIWKLDSVGSIDKIGSDHAWARNVYIWAIPTYLYNHDSQMRSIIKGHSFYTSKRGATRAHPTPRAIASRRAWLQPESGEILRIDIGPICTRGR